MCLKAIDLPCPPRIEYALGYMGGARFVGFGWDFDSSAPFYTDGAIGGDGDWVYLLYIGHPAVCDRLLRHAPLDGQVLLLDRLERCWAIGPRAEAKRWLAAQNPVSVMPFSVSEWETFLEGLKQVMTQAEAAVEPAVWDVVAQQREERLQAGRERLLHWLDQMLATVSGGMSHA